MKYPKSITSLIESFSNYPGIGKKTAERLALFSATDLDKSQLLDFSNALKEVAESIKECEICHMLTDMDICNICSNESRDVSKLIIVETTKDAFIFEKSNITDAYYHILNGRLSPMNGVSIQDLNFHTLIERLKNEEITEVILATSMTQDGEMTANYIAKILQNTDITVTRIARGLPLGGDIEYTDELTLKLALESRSKM